ncbi:hypothetical protein F66182_10813 [Fusarium sp. NRRL 66182]|nr:hypothetical protein F66182_10813 [Fusarium sp. NRRL 66182]
MEELIQKLGSNTAIVIRAFSSLRLCSGQLPPMELQFLNQAVEAITIQLQGNCGLSMIEFEVLVGYAARLDPTEQLPFLTTRANIIRSARPANALTEYDGEFLQFVYHILFGLLSNAQTPDAAQDTALAFAQSSTAQQTGRSVAIPFAHNETPDGFFAEPEVSNPPFESGMWATSSNSMSSTISSDNNTSGSSSISNSVIMSATSGMFTVSSIPIISTQITSFNISSWMEGLTDMPQVGDLDSIPFAGLLNSSFIESLPQDPRLEVPANVSFDQLPDFSWTEEQVSRFLAWLESGGLDSTSRG